MLIIHTADLHLGSQLANFDSNKREIRRNELINSFSSLVDFAKNNGVRVIIIAGDLFDDSFIDLNEFNKVIEIIKSNPDIYFLYTLGNHDEVKAFDNVSFQNLKVFNKDIIEGIEIEDVSFYGIRFLKRYDEDFYSKLNFESKNKNVLIMHGEIVDYFDKNKISKLKLENKNINYLALGHIHKNGVWKLDSNGIYAYPGCLEGRGFDEIGVKGFYLIDTSDILNPKFIANSYRIVEEINIDVTGCNNDSELLDRINKNLTHIKNYNKNIYRIILVGKRKETLDISLNFLNEYFKNSVFYIEIKDQTILDFDKDALLKEISFKGEFVRQVINDNSLSEEVKEKIISLGLDYIIRTTKL